MKKILFLIILISGIALSQTQVFDQNASNVYKNYSAATTGDTLLKKAAAVSGSSIPTARTGITGYLVGLLIGTPISKDTITVKNGVGTVVSIILDSTYTSGTTGATTRYTTPIYVPVNARVDTSLIYVQKKTSNVTVIFQTRKP